MSTVSVKRGDIGVLFTDSPAAAGVDFNDVDSALFLLRNTDPNNEELIEAIATTSNPAIGSIDISYTSQAGDLDVSGLYRCEWELTFVGGAVLTFPSGGYNFVKIRDDLNPGS